MKRKTRTWINRAVSVAVAVAMVPGMWASAAGAHDGKLTDRVTHSDKNFNDYEYIRMDEKDFDEIIDGLQDLADDPASADAVLDVIIAMEDYFSEMSANYSIARIYSDKVADDQYWDDEVKFYDELAHSVYDKLMQSYRTIATSTNSDVLHDRVDDEDDWQEILDYVDMTQEQKDLAAKETELSLQYDILYNKEYTSTIGGKKYTKDELTEAMNNGQIQQNDYMTAYADILKQANEERGQLYLELVDIRTQIAKSYGYDNYAEYAYEESYDRDYSISDLDAYRQDIKDYLIPAQDQLTLQLFLYYSDQLQDAFKEPMSVQESLDIMYKYLPEISNDMLVSLDYMVDHDLYDLEVNDKKAPGGYTTQISGQYFAPFMYNCADGTYSDMRTVIHEFGHYNELYYMDHDSWYYGSTDLDIAEIHSQGLELLFMDYSDEIFGDYGEVMNLYTVYNLTYAAVEGAKEDYFQYLVYTNADGLTLDKVNELYYDCVMEYGGQYGSLLSDSISLANAGYLDKNVSYDWVNIPHTFQSPMYYISYSVSVAAVLELFDRILDDRDAGIDMYLSLVDAEFQEPFQDTLATVGLNNPITNPRFDVYASDLLYYLGLSEERIVDNTVYGGDDPSTDPGTGTDPKPTQKPDKDSDKDDDDWEDGDIDVVKDVGVSTGVIIALAVIGVLFVAVLIVLIILLAKRSKEKKAERYAQAAPGAIPPGGYMPQNNNMAGAPGMPGAPGAMGGRPGMPGAPGMGGAPGMNGAPGAMGGRPGMSGAPGMGGAPGMNGMPGMNGTPGMNGMPGRPMQQGNPYMQSISQQGAPGNPYMQNNNMMQSNNQGTPYMNNAAPGMQQNRPLFDPFKNNEPVQNSNPYMQGNPYAGFGINQATNNSAAMNQPGNVQQPMGQQTGMGQSMNILPPINQPVNNDQAAVADQTAAAQQPAETIAAPVQDQPAAVNTDSISADTDNTRAVFAAGASVNESSISGTAPITESSLSGPVPMGPQSDDRPAPKPLGEIKTQMPNTAPNPFLQNLENMKKESDDTGNT